jgi:hypothetical protein
LRSGFTALIHPGTPVQAIDRDATRASRAEIREQVHWRARLLALLATAPIGDESVWIGNGSADINSDQVMVT